jgi:hypothetical protein
MHMRVRHWLFVFSVGFGLAGAFGTGCGGTTDNGTGTTTDGGGTPDVTKETAASDTYSPPDTSTISDAAVACAVDADLTTYAPPDAALGDSGKSVGTCIACIRSACPTQLSDCNNDCDCKGAVIDFIACVQAGDKTLIQCGYQVFGPLGFSNLPAVHLGYCLQSSACPGECAANFDAAAFDAAGFGD